MHAKSAEHANDEGSSDPLTALTARTPDGDLVTVRRHVEHLESSYDGPPEDMFHLNSRDMPVNRSEDGWFQCRNSKKFRNHCAGIGSFGGFDESDFELDPEIRFSSAKYCLNLGRYGPFRRQDRKTE